MCRNPSFGLATKAKGVARLRAKKKPESQGKRKLGSHITYSRECKKVWGSVREWTLTLLRQLPLWEMESRWTPEILESDCRGQNSMARGVLYIIGKLLERRCVKWARMAHLNIWNTSYGQKKGRQSTATLTPDHKKSGSDPIYLAIGVVPHIVGKLSTRATTLLQTELRSKVCSQSYGAPKSRESHLARFWDSHSGVPGKIAIWM